MAKETRTINGSIRIGKTLYNSDSVEEFAAAASPEQLARLTEKGVISGFVKEAKTADEKTEPAAAKGKK